MADMQTRVTGRTAKRAVLLASGAGAVALTALPAFVAPSVHLPASMQLHSEAQVASETSSSSSAAGPAGLVAGTACAALMAAGLQSRSKRQPRSSKRAVGLSQQVETECINSIRFLAVDAVNKSNSGHPGAPMGQAPIGYLLFSEVMNFNPAHSKWANRDRFVLSSGHGCMLQYSLLHLAGYKDVSIEDIKQFRQWGSKTPGHPENFETDGIEVTTGPLGMGVSNAVGLAAAEAHLSAVYNKPGMPLVDHYTYCIVGDGCMQEGISHESCSLAGHLGLGKLIVFYDDNGITIDGHTDLSFTEDVGKRFEAYGWQVLTVKDGNTDVAALREAVKQAKAETSKPTLIKVKTIIGYGSPNKADSHDAHGAPLGKDEAAATRKQLNWPYGEFEVPQAAYDVYRKHAAAGAEKEAAWLKMWEDYKQKEPALAAQFQRTVLDNKLPEGWEKALPHYSASEKGKATRINSQECLNALAPIMPELIGGSADLAPSNMTLMKCTGDFLKGQYENRNMRFGIREFGMAAIANAMSLHKSGLVPYCATFTIFTDYMRNAIRIAALSQAGTIFVTTHDSVALGEDGPTHQPIEIISSLRMIPDLVVFRPADGNETAGAYKVAVERSKYQSRPTLLALSRQVLANLEKSSIANVEKGAYAVLEADSPDIILVSTGSEVGLVLNVAKELAGKKVRVVSMPSWELFRAQPKSYKDSILPKSVPTLSVEAGVTFGWGEWAHGHVGIDRFGASAPGDVCMAKFGISVANVKAAAERLLAGERGVLSDGKDAK